MKGKILMCFTSLNNVEKINCCHSLLNMSIFAVINCFIGLLPILFAFGILFIFNRNYLDVGLSLSGACLSLAVSKQASFSVPSPPYVSKSHLFVPPNPSYLPLPQQYQAMPWLACCLVYCSPQSKTATCQSQFSKIFFHCMLIMRIENRF